MKDVLQIPKKRLAVAMSIPEHRIPNIPEKIVINPENMDWFAELTEEIKETVLTKGQMVFPVLRSIYVHRMERDGVELCLPKARQFKPVERHHCFRWNKRDFELLEIPAHIRGSIFLSVDKKVLANYYGASSEAQVVKVIVRERISLEDPNDRSMVVNIFPSESKEPRYRLLKVNDVYGDDPRVSISGTSQFLLFKKLKPGKK